MVRRLWIGSFEVALALAAFAVGTSLVRSLAPPAEGGRLDAKLEYFERHKDEYDAVIFGASRVFRGLDPRFVEEQLSAEGFDLRVFNFGASGMWTFEQDYLLHEVLALEPARLRWIFYGGRPIGISNPWHHGFDDDENLFSARGVQWHTLDETRKVLASIRRLPLPWGEKLELALTHVELCARNLSNLGRGSSILGHWFPGGSKLARDKLLQEIIHEQRGYFGLGGSAQRPRAEEMEADLRDPATYDNRIARIPEENALPFVLEEVNVEVYREQMRAAREHGAEIVYFTAPGFEGSPERVSLFDLGVLPNLLHFNDPVSHPELFLVEERFDRSHLNREGTERFSRLFGAAVVEHLRARAGSPQR